MGVSKLVRKKVFLPPVNDALLLPLKLFRSAHGISVRVSVGIGTGTRPWFGTKKTGLTFDNAIRRWHRSRRWSISRLGFPICLRATGTAGWCCRITHGSQWILSGWWLVILIISLREKKLDQRGGSRRQSNRPTLVVLSQRSKQCVTKWMWGGGALITMITLITLSTGCWQIYFAIDTGWSKQVDNENCRNSAPTFISNFWFFLTFFFEIFWNLNFSIFFLWISIKFCLGFHITIGQLPPPFRLSNTNEIVWITL